MKFNSIEFALFLPLIFALYWIIPKSKNYLRNILLLIASYVFYGWWDARFLILILFSTLVDYVVGYELGKTDDAKRRKILLWTSLTINLGLLGFFKYFNFFVESFRDAFSLFGQSFDSWTLNIILPVGISFYTFQTLSYTIDVYKRKLEPSKSFLNFATYVSFFPQLVAGPIERAINLLPQFDTPKVFSYQASVNGLRQVLIGLFKKMVIADNCAVIVNSIFENYTEMNASALVIGVVFFAFQLYGDFSGYSDIALGVSRLFGFNLMRNFAYPFFSRDFAEFWNRWHISLSTWFRDYIYFPIGGSLGSRWSTIKNTMIIFTISGFWHGSAWTFIIFGVLHGLFFIPLLLSKNRKPYKEIVANNAMFPTFKDVFGIISTFGFLCLSFVVFRSESMLEAKIYFLRMFDSSILDIPNYKGFYDLIHVYYLVTFLFVMEWFGRRGQFAISRIDHLPGGRLSRYAVYLTLGLLILKFTGEEQAFIYFQF